AERIVDRILDLAWLCLVEGVIQVALWIGFTEIDGRWNNPVINSQNSGYRFGGSCCTEHVARHRLSRVQVDVVSMLPEHLLDGVGFRNISQRGRSAMHIDVLHLCGTDFRS